jgi:DNA-binding beta-propeller fold protein YncE
MPRLGFRTTFGARLLRANPSTEPSRREEDTVIGVQDTTAQPHRGGEQNADGLLLVLEVSEGGRIFSLATNGSDRRVIVTDCGHPDGVAVDAAAGHIYWTNMATPPVNDGSIERADLDGQNRTTIVPAGGTFTPKQLVLEARSRKLYWSDREGMRVMRSNLDGSDIEILVQRGRGDADRSDQTRWCVGIAVDAARGQIYWTQKGPDDAGLGRIFRSNLEIPDGQSAVDRTDIEVLFEGLPEPIDLELDLANRVFYWTDRGDPPRGNSVSRALMDAGPEPRSSEILVTHLMEGIGIALDLAGGRMFLTDLAGTVYSARLDGSDKKPLAIVQGNLSGIAYLR